MKVGIIVDNPQRDLAGCTILAKELKKYNYYATLNINKSLPEISISSSSQILFTIRAKKETDSKTNKITYRNYIEKGPFLGQLIATSASQE